MRKFLMIIMAVVFTTGTAFAERYVMVTHGEGKDPFWPVVQKGGEDPARAIGILTTRANITSIEKILMTNAGSGYTTTPTISITGGGGIAGRLAKRLHYPGTSGGFASVGTGIGNQQNMLQQLLGNQ